MSQTPGLPADLVKKLQDKFEADPKNILAQNVCVNNNIWESSRSRQRRQETQHRFSVKLEKEGKPMTNQEHSGRCWIFACLNLMRIPFMKKYELEEFEFSQSYLFFWDKVERANYLLNAFVECARKGETTGSRLVSHLLTNPSEDGGQWDMLTNLVEKYGVVPKSHYPESWSAENSNRLGRTVNSRLREYCMRLQKMVADNKSDEEINKEKEDMIEEIHRLMCITLGTPPSTITFQYYTKTEFQSIGPISPHDFYHTIIKPDLFDMEDMVCVVNDPRPQHPYDKLYTVDYLGNMVGGKPVLYINKPIDFLKKVAIQTLSEEKQPVWFGCDVLKHYSGKDSSLDLDILDFKLMFGIDVLKMNKAERLMYGDSLMTHAMVFTGVNVTDDVADKWRVQNSWGDQSAEKGFLLMTDDWFSEFVYEVVVSKKVLDSETLAILEQKPVILPAWDPMGALAKAAN